MFRVLFFSILLLLAYFSSSEEKRIEQVSTKIHSQEQKPKYPSTSLNTPRLLSESKESLPSLKKRLEEQRWIERANNYELSERELLELGSILTQIEMLELEQLRVEVESVEAWVSSNLD